MRRGLEGVWVDGGGDRGGLRRGEGGRGGERGVEEGRGGRGGERGARRGEGGPVTGSILT